ncbi:MAG: cupin domain-containing protein [Caldilineales bacterium]|nr:cupin domain-containing protein [Caldilineales bacterium]
MKGRLYTASMIDELAPLRGERRLVLTEDDRITPLAVDRAREIGVEIVYGDGSKAGVPTWSGAALQARRKRISAPESEIASAHTPALEPPADLETLVRRTVASVLGQAETRPTSNPVQPAITHVAGSKILLESGPEVGGRRQQAFARRYGAPTAAGFITLQNGQHAHAADADEVVYVIEGELRVESEAGEIAVSVGDVIFSPRGSHAVYATGSKVKIFYVTLPASRVDD